MLASSQVQSQCLGCCSAVPQHLIAQKNAPVLGEIGQNALAWGGPLFLAFLIWVFAQLKAYLQVRPSWGYRSVSIEGRNQSSSSVGVEGVPLCRLQVAPLREQPMPIWWAPDCFAANSANLPVRDLLSSAPASAEGGVQPLSVHRPPPDPFLQKHFLFAQGQQCFYLAALCTPA